MMWWETVPAQIVMWGTAFLVGGAVIYKLWQASERLRRIVVALLSIGVTQTWPNGSTDLSSSLTVIYEEVRVVAAKLDAHLAEHGRV